MILFFANLGSLGRAFIFLRGFEVVCLFVLCFMSARKMMSR